MRLIASNCGCIGELFCECNELTHTVTSVGCSGIYKSNDDSGPFSNVERQYNIKGSPHVGKCKYKIGGQNIELNPVSIGLNPPTTMDQQNTTITCVKESIQRLIEYV